MEVKAWLCIIGAILINLSLGTFYSIGNIITYVASYMRNHGNPDVTNEHGTWITAAFLLGQGIFIIAGSQIERHFDNRVACIVGCILHCSSTFLTIYAIDINFLAVVVVYGFGSGLGCGSAYMASIIAAQKWFPRSKSIFTGVIVGGFGLGGCIFTSLQTLYMNPKNLPQDEYGYFDELVFSRVPNLFVTMGLIFVVMQAIGCALAFPPPSSSQNANKDGQTQSEIRTSSPTGNPTTIVDSDILPNLTSLQSVFGHKIFYIIGLMMMLVAPGITFVNSLGRRYGQSYLNNDKFLATVVAVASVTNALGRLSWGFLMSKLAFSECYIVKVGLFSILIALFPFGFILGKESLYFIWMLGLSFGFSGTFVLFPVFIEQVFGPRYHGSIYGILYIFLAIAAILTSLGIQLTIVPALENKKSDDPDSLFIRLGPCAFISALYILSLVLYASCIPVKKLENSIRRRIESDVEKTRNTLLNRQDLYPLDRGTLAERTRNSRNLGAGAGSGGVERENSLGSIVRFRDAGLKGENRIKSFGK